MQKSLLSLSVALTIAVAPTVTATAFVVAAAAAPTKAHAGLVLSEPDLPKTSSVLAPTWYSALWARLMG